MNNCLLKCYKNELKLESLFSLLECESSAKVFIEWDTYLFTGRPDDMCHKSDYTSHQLCTHILPYFDEYRLISGLGLHNDEI